MIVIWLYARLLRLYPRAFYERFGAEMLDVFTQAWQARGSGRTAALHFCARELGGLLLSIASEHQRANTLSGLAVLFRRRFIPVWLLVISLLIGGVFSLNYWGYLSVPSSTFSQVQTVDSIVLARFDEDYSATAIPLTERPWLITPGFPPSQILSQIPPALGIERTLDAALTAELAEALADADVFLGVSYKHPSEPVGSPDDCGQACFQPGVQPQPDGSIQVTYPRMELEGQQPVEAMTQWVTPNDWWYYLYVIPAGYIVQGTDANGERLVFAAIASGAFGNDRYRYHELTFRREADGLILQNRMSYNFDISGLEGINAAVCGLVLFLPLLFAWFAVVLIGALLGFVRRQARRRRSLA
ncbi:MAG: hypothetical protein JNJ61_13210 [Anaerolineae bacterium]|nr:hypothetical protein [Anaerolineae bacterium]